MTKEHFNHLKEICSETIKKHPNMKQEYSDKGLSSMRYIWDILDLSDDSLNFICSHLYSYLDDTHINTALKNICKC